MNPVSASDYRDLARRRLPHFLFEYIDGGAYDEVTLQRNRADLLEIALRQRVLCDVDDIDTSIEVLGSRWSLPIALGPIGLAGMNARRGERQAAQAAEAAGVPFCLSTVSACSIAEVRAAVNNPFWFQLYMARDRGFMSDLLARAEAAGCGTLVFTVDMPVPGARYRDYRSGLAGATGPHGAFRRTLQALARPAWAWDVGLMGRPHALGNLSPVLGEHSGLKDFFAWMSANFDASVTWKDLEFVRARWRGPILLKGVLDEEDARLAADAGFEGVIVSNHGGRQLDGVVSTARALPSIAARVGDDLAVFADGGVRSGLDVAKLIALGAKGVFLGRAWAYALAGGGRAGVRDLLSIMERELKVAMALTGVRRVEDLGPWVLSGGGSAAPVPRGAARPADPEQHESSRRLHD